MARKDISTLRDEAMAAVEKGKLGKAAELYEALEALEPQSAAWSKRLGETLRRAGDKPAAVTAFERAAEKFVQSGFLVQAIAVCKMILQIDPTHVATVERLAALAPAPQVTVDAVHELPVPRVKSSRPAMLRPGKPPGVDIPPGSSLDSIELAVIVAGSHSPPNLDGSSSGITILPLDQPSSIELSLGELELVPEAPPISATARLALSRTPLFAELHPRVLEQLIPRMELVDLAAGDTLFREGDAGGSLYVISEGEVTVETSGTELARLGPGAFFGEIALVTDLPRSATVRALSGCRCP